MDELKRRILSDAVVGAGDIIHVDMFLNHCMDMDLMERMGSTLAKRFRSEHITKVLTAEIAGVGVAIEKAMREGGRVLRRMGIRVEALATVERIEGGHIILA